MSTTQASTRHFDVVIIGSGAAGLTTALQLPENLKVAIICKQALKSGATPWAQGGVAAVLDEQDSVDSHCSDTMTAGAHLNDPDMVRFIVEDSTDSIHWLIDQGVPFTRDTVDEPLMSEKDGFHLTKAVSYTHLTLPTKA